MRYLWRATYDDGLISTADVPRGYEDLDRARPFTFELLDHDGRVIRSWRVEPWQRLLYRTRNRAIVGDAGDLTELSAFAILGIEDRTSGDPLEVWILVPDSGGITATRRDSWGQDATWLRPEPYPGE